MENGPFKSQTLDENMFKQSKVSVPHKEILFKKLGMKMDEEKVDNIHLEGNGKLHLGLYPS